MDKINQIYFEAKLNSVDVSKKEKSWHLKAGVVAQLWKHLPCEPEEWDLDPLNPCKFGMDIAAPC